MSLVKIKAEVWLYPGLSGWHFVTLDKDFSAKIREKYKTGFVKVEAKIGKTSWNTSLFPHKLSKSYLLCIKSYVRKIEGVFEGDKIDVQIKII
jgi:Domain of unknown function (DUF1905)